MNRTDFFTHLFKGLDSKRNSQTSSLVEYASPLTKEEAYHLIRRCTFVPTQEMANQLTGMTANQAVDLLISNADNKKEPTAPSWANDTFLDPLNGGSADENGSKYHYHNGLLKTWWANQMRNDTNSVLEKMVLFWHGHFATQYNICNTIPGVAMFSQNQKFRSSYLGDFRQLLIDLTLDGAMMLYLNNNENVVGRPNENYARELMELFCLGVGHYTELDVREAARILTGWKINYYSNTSRPTHIAYTKETDFDADSKVFMNTTFDFPHDKTDENIKKYSIEKLIDTLLIQRSVEVSEFMATKIYKLFVYANPTEANQEVISQMAVTFRESNWNLKTMVAQLLKSKHFFDSNNYGVQPKSPAETILGFSRQFKDEITNELGTMEELGMTLLSPPNVAGWKGYRSWVTSKNIPFIATHTAEVIDELSSSFLVSWANKFAGYNSDKALFAKEVTTLLLARPLSSTRLSTFTGHLNGWDAESLKSLLKETTKSPDFYLY